MKISLLEEYGLRCLAQLASGPGKMTIAQIAREQGLSEENTAKVMARLRALGFVASLRGKGGGYLLARPAAQISLAEVVEKISGCLFEIERCHTESCTHRNGCALRPVWTQLEILVHDFLDALSIADLTAKEAHVAITVGRRLAENDTLRLAALSRARSSSVANPSRD